ncbi:sterol desaturase family protein [Sphingomonas sp. ID0503]|uniref:sterol desaturase family protein n=1 Tax=Sphingomonas sp. ID0503 TaxID=3399691 RepID=UPI003AFAB58D
MSTVSSSRTGFWSRTHHLDRMNLRELWIAYFQYPAILAYIGCAALAFGGWLYRPSSPLQTMAAILAAVLIYPLVWYVLHRWVLHSKWMWRSSLLAGTWKRIHYDHHQDPNNLEVLFGGLHTTLPTILAATAPVGWLIGGWGGACMAIAAGLVTTCVYEFFHCIQHLGYKPKNKWVAHIKQRHLAHHFHNEDGNYGITNYLWDRVFGTYYERIGERKKSPTVHNLGYTAEVAKRYPHVARLTGRVGPDRPTTRSAR